MIKLGAIVSVQHGSRYGVVVELFDHGNRKLACVHYIDPANGELLKCVDHARCGSIGHTCPIHSTNVDTHAIDAFPTKDVVFYVSEGMVSTTIARKATAPVLRISRHQRHIYEVETLEDGVCTRTIKTDATKGDQWQTCVAICNTLPYGTSATLHDPDSEDYKELATLFADHPLGPVTV